MPKRSFVLASILVTFLAAVPASAKENFSIGLMAGLGGALDSSVDAGFGGSSWQAIFTVQTKPKTSWSLRVGELDLESDLSAQFDTTMTYYTLAGEYRSADSFFESGMYFGLGFYEVDGTPVLGSESQLGLNFGVTGEFEITKRISFLAEVSSHFTDLDYGQLFVIGHGGITFHF